MKIFLRPVTLADGLMITKWRNHKDVINHCLSKAMITEESNKEFFNNYVLTGKYKQFIVERIDDDFGVIAYPIATVYLKDVDYVNKRCELCIFTSNDEEWKHNSQIIAIQMLLEKAFNEYDMHKVYSYVYKKFPNEIDLLKGAGFSIETILIDEARKDDGEYEDIVRLFILNSERFRLTV